MSGVTNNVGFGLFPTQTRPTHHHLLFIGGQGSGKRSVAQRLTHLRDTLTTTLRVHTTSHLPLTNSTLSAQHIDYIVLFVNFTDRQALDTLQSHLALIPTDYYLGRLAIVGTFFDQKLQHAFDVTTLETIVEELCELPIYYANAQLTHYLNIYTLLWLPYCPNVTRGCVYFQDETQCADLASKLLNALDTAVGSQFPITPSVVDIPDVKQLVVTSLPT
ncbi:hypothetical protein IWQ62_006816 [Dispira parvispora]|uniref:Centromere protein M n=1 Tax=Dispira parvispora TaxID=1520584 RepID=A0A9W8E3A6_9FUNG|nr:hypothetical protein IWQ62_006816 [Dispira parvispora]